MSGVSAFYVALTRSPLLSKYLGQSRIRDIIYSGYMSNHESYNIVVLGCSNLEERDVERRMEEWQHHYMRKPLDMPREVTADMPPITDENWTAHIGDPRAQFNWLYPVYLEYFDAKVKALGLQGALQRYFPDLISGMAACALHTVIHFGFALEAGDAGMAAEGLALMCSVSHRIGCGAAQWSSSAPGIIDLSVAYLQKAAEGAFHQLAVQTARTPHYMKYDVGSFQRKMLTFDDASIALGSSIDNMGPLGLPASDQPLLSAIREATALITAVYLASDCEFFIIHGLTSLHAVLVEIAYLDGHPDLQRKVLTHWWRTVMAVTVCQNIPNLLEKMLPSICTWKREEEKSTAGHPTPAADADPVDSLKGEDDAFWRHALEIALTSEDEHVPKAVYALWRWSQWGDMPRHSIALFREAVLNQIRSYPASAPHSVMWFADDDADRKDLRPEFAV